MLNEWQEFLDYTEPVEYRASGKKDTAWLGRFTFEALRDFSGMNRILTILARGFLFHALDGTPLPGDPRERIGFAYDCLCAWCSIPEDGGKSKEDWQHRTNFALLHDQFPKLVDEEGWGWFSRHFHEAMRFAATHPELVHKSYTASAERLDKLFDQEWRNKVLQYQTKALSTLTEGAWTIRFDDMIADALELGPLRRTEPELPLKLTERLEQVRPEKMPSNVLPTLVAYYLANRLEDSDWVVLPVTNFDCYFGNTNFGRKYLNQLPPEVIERGSSFGVSRYRVREEYLPK
ncbi:hypothetical protein [Flavonifractor plautii]|mgnify:FL=1|uniref:hypothetical protein n=1 Tax=Flavonifractor plautii TaxID=292800 RepID=UPI002109083E|nr:hypothetical protein [Flavonifractor plautii]MCQ5309290.1 hypothetical protein [Flavonifractor plautii]